MITTRAAITCDVEGCTASFDCGLRTGTATREAATQEGWLYLLVATRRGVAPTRDFCPTHAAEAEAWEATVRRDHPFLVEQGGGAR